MLWTLETDEDENLQDSRVDETDLAEHESTVAYTTLSDEKVEHRGTRTTTTTSFSGALSTFGQRRRRSIPPFPLSDDREAFFHTFGRAILGFTFFILSFMPILSLITNLLTAILYYERTIAIQNGEINESNGLMTIFICVIVFMAMRCRSFMVCFVSTSDHKSLLFADLDVNKNLCKIIPVCGSIMAEIIFQDSTFDVDGWCVCQHICFEISAVVLTPILTPLLMIYFIYRTAQIQWAKLRADMSLIYASNATKVQLQELTRPAKVARRREAKYMEQMVYLAMSDAIFDGIPQIILQCYVVDQFGASVYDDGCNDSLFVISLLTSLICLVQGIILFTLQLVRADNL